MKNLIFILLILLIISGCYTMINHPEVEVYYERENGEEYLTEEYDVFVDEDCSTCHDGFITQTHFSPLIPAHDLDYDWNDIPWWLDTKYLLFISGNDTNSANSYGYQHVSSQKRNPIPPAQSGGYIPVAPTGGSATGSSAATTGSRAAEGGSTGSKSRAAVSNQSSGGNSKTTSTTSKRKFRKRK